MNEAKVKCSKKGITFKDYVECLINTLSPQMLMLNPEMVELAAYLGVERSI